MLVDDDDDVDRPKKAWMTGRNAFLYGVHEAAKTRHFFTNLPISVPRLPIRMPKDRRSSSLERHRASPYQHCYKNTNKTRPKSPSPPIGTENEWEETRCPICIDHPHNAVLLLCSSREKGCRPYMCDTSSRHSNCFDQFRKSTMNPNSLQQQQQAKLVCPLCRGQITGWIVVDPARHFMNKKPRSCSSETCDFSGTYTELRKHARRDHPCVRPTEVNPDQELEWRILRENMEQQDMLNMQFEFDDTEPIEHVLEGLNELASPLWDLDMDFMNFLSNFETEFDNIFPEFDGNFLLDDWENMFEILSSNEPETTWSRGNSHGQNRSRENGSTTRRRSSRNGRQRANWSNQSSDSQQVQVTTWLDFYDIEPNLH
ncbi:hypothetical protein L2E82_02461 [Cichorium intybus]|uniref:Uncharacterized protein n=1 Tax=Cichorium intybus TaxID=13427 RepID=A0ACB9H1Q6_CICIN|nr:hypothetical protein L2E82_02461 [Cichorium intybus]